MQNCLLINHHNDPILLGIGKTNQEGKVYISISKKEFRPSESKVEVSKPGYKPYENRYSDVPNKVENYLEIEIKRIVHASVQERVFCGKRAIPQVKLKWGEPSDHESVANNYGIFEESFLLGVWDKDAPKDSSPHLLTICIEKGLRKYLAQSLAR